MTPRQTLAKIRKTLAAPELDGVRQGVELIAALDDPEIQATFCAGLSVDADGKIRWARGSEVAKRVKAAHRPWAALALMRLSGDLASVERLDLRGAGLPDYAVIADMPALAWLGLSAVGAGVAPLETLPGLRAIATENELPSAERLAALPALESVEVYTPAQRLDLSVLSSAPGLKRLRLERAWRFNGFERLDAPALESFEIEESSALSDLSFLQRSPGLKRLSLHRCYQVEDLSALASLADLRELELIQQYNLTDLSPLTGSAGLERVLIYSNYNLTDLSPLAGLPALRRLELIRCHAVDSASAFAGKAQLAEGVVVEDGRLRRDGQALEGWTLYAILATGAVDLSGVEHLSLHHWRGLDDLSFLQQAPRLKTLDLRSCEGLRDVWSLAALGDLERVDISRSAGIKPRPQRTGMTDRASVAAWQKKIAQALDKEPDRTPEQDALLEIARSAGLLGVEAIDPAERARRREEQETIKQIRRLLGADDLADAKQGVALLEALDDAALIAEFADGVSIGADHKLRVDPAAARRTHLRSYSRRGWVALAMLRLSGRLDGVEQIVVPGKMNVPDLSPLAELPDLWRLQIGCARGLTDLSPLAGLEKLERLTLMAAALVADLTPLAGLSALLRLKIQPASSIRDLTPLGGLAQLEWLSLRSPQMTDLSPLRTLPALARLDLRDSYSPRRPWHKLYRTRRAVLELLK